MDQLHQKISELETRMTLLQDQSSNAIETHVFELIAKSNRRNEKKLESLAHQLKQSHRSLEYRLVSNLGCLPTPMLTPNDTLSIQSSCIPNQSSELGEIAIEKPKSRRSLQTKAIPVSAQKNTIIQHTEDACVQPSLLYTMLYWIMEIVLAPFKLVLFPYYFLKALSRK